MASRQNAGVPRPDSAPWSPASREMRAECGIIQRRQFRKFGCVQIIAGVIADFTGVHRKFVPRANSQAIITTIDVIAHQRAQGLIHGALVFNRQVGNAAACVQLIGRGEGICGACIETGAAATAMIHFGRIHG